MHPVRVLGQIHSDVITWWTRDNAKTHQLLLLPRDHQKSALIAYRVAWELTKNPALRVLYISSTINLATKQLKFIKDIITSDIYRRYWPEMVNVDEAKREKWTETEISVDHPERKAQNVRDPSIFTAGLTTNIVGLHCDIAVLDDVVVDTSAYTEEGREKVRNQASYLASIAGTESRTWVVGTRYHPKDLYNDMMNQIVQLYDDNGDELESYHLYELMERQVEDRGDGTGNYLWPKMFGNKYGFDQKVLATKRAQYADVTKFRAQYYNNPNDLESAAIGRDCFQYYNRDLFVKEMGSWFYKDNRINVFAAVDFAFSLKKEADYTAIVVVGVDAKNNYYVLDIERFKTNKISDYYDRILRLHNKWDFRKIRAECTAGQSVIVRDLIDNYIRPNGLGLSVEEYRPTRNQGTKEERMDAILQPRYNNRQVYHYKGGRCEILEEELVLQKPPHDDIKDCLASAIDSCVPPSGRAAMQAHYFSQNKPTYINPRFGGVH